MIRMEAATCEGATPQTEVSEEEANVQYIYFVCMVIPYICCTPQTEVSEEEALISAASSHRARTLCAQLSWLQGGGSCCIYI